MDTKKNKFINGFATKAIHGGKDENINNGSLITPIYQSATFVFDSTEQGGRIFSGDEEGFLYTRVGNPTINQLEERLALLEGAEAALATASGMGAISAAIWSIIKSGDHIITSQTIYGCTYELFELGLSKFNIEVSFVDMKEPENVRKAMKDNTRLVFIETPANPNLILNDIKAIAEIAHENPNTLVMADNTFATPYLQQPLLLGADIIVHSATKYLNGHGDVIAGFIAGEKELNILVKDGADVVSELKVDVYVEGSNQLDWMNVLLVVLLVVAIIVLLTLVISIAKKKSDSNEDSSSEEYY